MNEFLAKLQEISAQVGVTLLVQFSNPDSGASFKLDNSNYEVIQKTIQVDHQSLLGWEVIDSTANKYAWEKIKLKKYPSQKA
jgi:hypothetical protein